MDKTDKTENMVIDPVCRMKIVVDEEKRQVGKSEYNGNYYFFCSPRYKTVFDKNPDKFISEVSK
jgi:YHS domain-containing protein